MNGNDTRLVLDQVHAVSDTVPGALKTLNLDNQPCGFFLVVISIRKANKCFRGCMDSA